MGYAVANTSRIGQGFPDAVVSQHGVNLLVEWKKDAAQKLTKAQVRFFGAWRGPIIAAITADEVHAEMQRLIGLQK